MFSKSSKYFKIHKENHTKAFKNHKNRNVAATSSPSPTSSTHSPTPYEQEPHLNEQQYQNQDLNEPSYQNASALAMTNGNGAKINGDGPKPVASTANNNNNSHEKINKTSESTEASAAATSPTSEDSHLNNHNSQINISKDNSIESTNQNRNSLALSKNNKDNNNPEELLYDIPVGE